MVFFVAGECNYLGIDDLDSFDFVYYPNPVKDILQLKSSHSIESAEVFNLAGQLVERFSNWTDKKLNMSGIKAGVYWVKTKLERGKVETFKVVKR